MRIAVVTPYYQEPRAWLERCIDSVRRQTVACEHIVVADGHAQGWVDHASGVRHIRLDRAHADYGNTPRSIGAQLAISEGFDAITFLDADNWYESDHVETCLATADASGADYVAAQRWWVRDDGSHLPYRADEDATGAHVDTSCFFLLFGAFHAVARWLLMPKPMAVVGDRAFLASLHADGLHGAMTPRPTVNYLCTWRNIYEEVGEVPPPSAKDLVTTGLHRWAQRLLPDDLRAVQRLAGCDVRAVL